MKAKAILLFLFIALCGSSFAQSKKEVKKYKIKSCTETVTDYSDGKEKTRQDAYMKFDGNVNVLEEIEYNKDGTFKKKEAHKYNKNDDVTEEIIYDEKGHVKKKTIIEYNAANDKTAETTYDVSGKIIEKIQYGYNAKGDKSF